MAMLQKLLHVLLGCALAAHAKMHTVKGVIERKSPSSLR